MSVFSLQLVALATAKRKNKNLISGKEYHWPEKIKILAVEKTIIDLSLCEEGQSGIKTVGQNSGSSLLLPCSQTRR